MYDLNDCTFTGRAAADGEVRVTPSGRHVLNFGLAVNNGKNKDGTERPVSWVNCVVWGDLADHLNPWVKKGKLLLVKGAYVPRSYEQNGEKKTSHDFIIRDFKALWKKNEEPRSEQTFLGDGEKDLMGYSVSEVNADDLPFY